MKVKRFSADTMRQAMAQVRQELGDDAVIISSRQLDRGVEVVVSLDARPTTSPSAESSAFFASRISVYESSARLRSYGTRYPGVERSG